MVRGKDRHGQPFDETTNSDNISQGGLAFLTRRELAEGAELDITILRPPMGRREQAPFFTTGKVVRIFTEPDGYRVAVQFTGPHFRTFVKES